MPSLLRVVRFIQVPDEPLAEGINMADTTPTSTPPKTNIIPAVVPKLAGTPKAPDRPFPEVLRSEAGRLARKLLSHPEVGLFLGDDGATINGLVKLTTYKGE